MSEQHTPVGVELPLYQCHKKVRAAKITGIAPSTSDSTLLKLEEVGGTVTVPLEWATKHKPQIGGYYVQYADGYISYSPAKAFEEGYTNLPAGYQGRVVQEHAELADNINKLEAYLEPLQPPPAPQPYETRILFDQLATMRSYRDILTLRIHNFA
jgi:hypothetical protein